MIISLNWIKKYIEIDLPIDKLSALIGERLVEIEHVIDLKEKHRDALVVKIVQAGKLDGSNHLNLTKIDDGGVTENIERDENGLIQVVCGAPNVRAGQLVVWLPPGSIVPMTHDTKEPFELGSRKLMGAMSNGMIASAKELDLYDEHESILEIVDDIKPGTLLVNAYELDDYLLDIENKSLTHRPDCFSIIGFAREIAGIEGKAFHTPDWLTNLSPDFSGIESDQVKLDVEIDNPELSARYTAVVMSGADSKKQSPLQIQTYLSRVGVRPINAVVDVTNYLMMLTGQPLHAFDYDKLVAVGGGKADIHVRAGRQGEELELLDSKVIKISTDDIVIAAGDTAIALAGAMGGANTEIDENTKNIIIESATFNLYNLRATQMRHGIFSEAITRFTKGQPASLTAPVLFEAVRLMGEWSGAKCVSKMTDDYPKKQEQISLNFLPDTVNDILDSNYTADEIVNVLENVEFEILKNDTGLIKATAPYWRADIHITEDIVEEISRLKGFDNIELSLPRRDFVAVKPDDFDKFRNVVRNILARSGANEVLTYSFIHNNVLQKASQNAENSYKVMNSISPNLQYYRQSLTPSLLGLIHPNVKQGYDNFALFEINKTHSKNYGLNDENVPIETDVIALVLAKKENQSSASFYDAKHILEYLSKSLGLDLLYEPATEISDEIINKPFEYRRSAKIIEKTSGQIIGVLGEYKKSVTKGFKLPKSTAGFEIYSRIVFDLVRKLESSYVPLSKYPSSERDICFKVDGSVFYDQIVNSVESVLRMENLEAKVSPVDIYSPKGSHAKNITIRIRLTAHDHTLTSDEVTVVINSITDIVIEKVGAEII